MFARLPMVYVPVSAPDGCRTICLAPVALDEHAASVKAKTTARAVVKMFFFKGFTTSFLVGIYLRLLSKNWANKAGLVNCAYSLKSYTMPFTRM